MFWLGSVLALKPPKCIIRMIAKDADLSQDGKIALEFHTKKCDLPRPALNSTLCIFQISGKIDLLKIDVDDRESYEAVFAGVIPILHKVEILQIEMLEEEIGRHGMMWIADTFLSQDFMILGLFKVRMSQTFVSGNGGWTSRGITIFSQFEAQDVWP